MKSKRIEGKYIRLAKKALAAIMADDSVPAQDRIHAAETILAYGLRADLNAPEDK